MINKLLIAFCVVSFISCNEINEEDNIPTSKVELLTSLEESDSTQTEESKETEQKKSELLLTARGSEPGWFAEFYNDRLRLLTDHGQDSLHLNDDFSNIIADKEFVKTILKQSTVNGKTQKASLKIHLKKEKCTEEASGESREYSIIITYNNQTYKGCATPKK